MEAFLAGRISFPGIGAVVEETLAQVPVGEPDSIAGLLEIDRESRAVARGMVERRAERPVTLSI